MELIDKDSKCVLKKTLVKKTNNLFIVFPGINLYEVKEKLKDLVDNKPVTLNSKVILFNKNFYTDIKEHDPEQEIEDIVTRIEREFNTCKDNTNVIVQWSNNLYNKIIKDKLFKDNSIIQVVPNDKCYPWYINYLHSDSIDYTTWYYDNIKPMYHMAIDSWVFMIRDSLSKIQNILGNKNCLLVEVMNDHTIGEVYVNP